MVAARADRDAQATLVDWISKGSGEPGRSISCKDFSKWAAREARWIECKQPVLPWTFDGKKYIEYLDSISPAENTVDPSLMRHILNLKRDSSDFKVLLNKRTAGLELYHKYCDENEKMKSFCSGCFSRGAENMLTHDVGKCLSSYCLTQITVPRLKERSICPICLVLADSQADMKCHMSFHHQRDLAFFGICRLKMLDCFPARYKEAISKVFP